MTTALSVYDQFDQLQMAAIALQESGYFKDVTSKAQAIVKVMAGAELGLPPFASMTGIHIIHGKPVLGANVIATLVKNDPRYDYQIKTAAENICELEWFEYGAGTTNRSVGVSTFTWDEALKAGLTSKDNWKKYPSDMLFARAISRGARRFAPGIFGGSPIYTPDEVGADVDEDGNTIIEGIANEPQLHKMEQQPQMQPQPYPKPDPEPNPGDNNSKMSLESAQEVTNRDGVKYADLDSSKLQIMARALTKSLQEEIVDGNSLTYDEVIEREYKLDAIAVLLANR